MNSQKKVFFHVGLGKTGTTYLQYRVFPKFKNIHYIQRTKYHDFQYVKIIQKSDHKRFLVSREFDRQLERELKNIQSVLPKARIIIVLRRQDQWIASQYRRQVKNGKTYDFNDFIDLQNDQGKWKKKVLYFHPKLEMIRDMFGPPLVLFHNNLKEKPHTYFRKIADFVGADYQKKDINLKPLHKSYNKKQLKAMKAAGKFLFKNKNFNYSNNYIIKKIQRYAYMLPRYFILYSSLLVPESWLNNKALIKDRELEKVRNYYHDDWQKCKQFATRYNPV